MLPDISGATLSDTETRRFGRHLILPELGLEGQLRLKAGKVLLIGAGGLGSPAALYLAAAGVGCIGLVDADRVEETNLQRQIAHGYSTLGQQKTESAAARMLDLNPDLDVRCHDVFLSVENALELISQYDVVIDGTDNFPTRYLVNDACTKLGKPNVFGGVLRFDGQLSVFDARFGPCYRCLFPEPPPVELAPNCAEAGVLGVLPGIIGVLQATEAIKLLADIGTPMIGRMLVYDALDLSFDTVTLAKAPNCPCCSKAPADITLKAEPMVCSAPRLGASITPGALQARLDAGEDVVLLDVRNAIEWAGGVIPGAKLISKPDIEAALREGPAGLLTGVLTGIPRTREVIVYCQAGLRSAAVIRALASSGYDPALLTDLEDGFAGWQGQKAFPLPVEA
jgi:adenylyltransferase/sulfurtransferase